MSRKNLLEKAALVFAAVTVGAAAWFWTLQVQSVIELLRMAYG